MGVLGDNKEKEPKTGFFSKIMDIFGGGALGEKGKDNSNKTRAMKLKDLETRVMDVFEERLEVLTTDESLLFPAKFEIYMNTVDFNNLAGAYANASRDLTKKFCRRLKEKYAEIKRENPDFEFISHTSRWYFQFLPFDDGMVVNDKQEVQQGAIFAITEVFPPLHENESRSDSGAGVQTLPNVTPLPVQTIADGKTSLIVNLNINKDFYKDLIKVGENAFEIEFEGIIPPPTPPSFAQLKWIEGNNTKVLGMNQKDIKIAGNFDKAMDGGISVLNLKNNNILSPHIHIRYDESSGEFKIMPFGETKLNGIKLSLKEWHNLPKKNAKILMGSGFSLVQMDFDGLV